MVCIRLQWFFFSIYVGQKIQGTGFGSGQGAAAEGRNNDTGQTSKKDGQKQAGRYLLACTM